MPAQNENSIIERTSEVHSGSSDEGVLAGLGINSQLFVWQLINFALVAFVVWYKILKPLTKKLDERKKIIDESLNKAKKIEDSYAKSKAEYDAALKQAQSEANGIISGAKQVAGELSEAMKAKTKADIDGLVKQAKVKINEERDAVMEGVKIELANLVGTATEKILREKLDDKKDQKLIGDTLKSLE